MQDKILQNIIYEISECDSQQAFREFFNHYFPQLLHYSNAIVDNKQVAEEIVCDTFLAFWKNRKMAGTIKSVPYYLYTSCKNGCINYLTRERKRHLIDIDSIESNLCFTYRNPETDAISKENVRHLLEAVKTLPPKCQLILRLIKEEGFNYKETAALLEISVKTVEAQMVIAMKKLKEYFDVSNAAQFSPSQKKINNF